MYGTSFESDVFHISDPRYLLSLNTYPRKWHEYRQAWGRKQAESNLESPTRTRRNGMSTDRHRNGRQAQSNLESQIHTRANGMSTDRYRGGRQVESNPEAPTCTQAGAIHADMAGGRANQTFKTDVFPEQRGRVRSIRRRPEDWVAGKEKTSPSRCAHLATEGRAILCWNFKRQRKRMSCGLRPFSARR